MLTPTVTEISRGSAHRHHAGAQPRSAGLRGFHETRRSPRSAPAGGPPGKAKSLIRVLEATSQGP